MTDTPKRTSIVIARKPRPLRPAELRPGRVRPEISPEDEAAAAEFVQRVLADAKAAMRRRK